MARNYDAMIRNVLRSLESRSQTRNSSSGATIWKAEIRHEGLNKYRVIRGCDRDVVEQMAETQIAAWNEMWEKRQKIQINKQEREDIRLQKKQELQANIDEANKRTGEAKEAIDEIKNILKNTLSINDAINWNLLKDYSSYTKPKPNPPIVLKLSLKKIPPLPIETEAKYQPQLGFFDKVLSSRKQEKIEDAKLCYKRDFEQWYKEKEEIEKANEEHVLKIKKHNDELEKQYQKEMSQWENEKQNYLSAQKKKNDAIDKRKAMYLGKDTDTIVEYCELVLSNSKYPDYFPQEFDLDYNPETKIMIVDYSLPPIEVLPRLNEVKYIKTRNELSESFLADSTVNNLYDDLIYQITLRTIHELYESDVVNAIDSIIFNGIVESIDKATGQTATACIVSVQANKQEFMSINLEHVDPKACFKKLKGIGSSKLHSLTPIAPILNINREDKRFVSSYQVVDELGDTYNLAAMDWEDFEHMIRELFEKEFSQSGGEVKVTRSSRDAGVDAVAFDPDPIRGGKIVIQAKRYTNTVGVSAVRDLFGTVMNEGATKGILVSTADYGPDAYEFAKGKPLTLLNGSNLLHLLEKHGHKAKIDLREAKQILAEQEKQKNS
ncbi:MAG: restriction endonuclease [Planctomycetes bacterium]|nr:restriction endonuclease [Planctomycetota bacterium]MBM4064147.1 restriction endonuclease [Planctomycetota bacterium]